MKAHHIAGLRSMGAGVAVAALAAIEFFAIAPTRPEGVHILTIFVPLYIFFAAGLFIFLHGLITHFPNSHVRVHHAIAYTLLAIAVIALSYCIFQALSFL